ncbi:hypothetical protein CR513_36961, partial [Mucuna pruriens]
MVVTKKVSLAFTLGKYSDELLCDVVPIEATSILPGRPWQYDHEVNHDGKMQREVGQEPHKTLFQLDAENGYPYKREQSGIVHPLPIWASPHQSI